MSDLRRRRGRRRGAKDLDGDAEKKRRGDRTTAIKYNYFPIEWKLFGNERRVIGDIHTFIKRFSLSSSGCLHPSRSIHPYFIAPLRLAPLYFFFSFFPLFSFFSFFLLLFLFFFNFSVDRRCIAGTHGKLSPLLLFYSIVLPVEEEIPRFCGQSPRM